MRRNVMKKALSTFMAMVILLTIYSVMVSAENDAVDLGYSLQITVTDDNGAAKDTFQIGEMIYVKLSLTYTGAGKAPVYGLQGELHYDPYIIRNTSVKEKNDVKTQGISGQITYAFLDMTGQGKSDSMLGNIGETVFVAKSNGAVSLYGDNFIVTNKDASQRYIDASATATLVIGTGVKEVTKELLEADIAAAEKMIADCTVTDKANPGIYYPDFWVTTETAQTFQTAIDMAKAVCEKENAEKSEIELAVAQLDLATKQFEESKIFGPRRWSGTVTVTALVQGGNGKIAVGFITQKCRLNTSCTIRMQPDEGYETEYVYVNGKQFPGNDIFTFPSVSRDTTVAVTFCRKPPFTDIAQSDWFYISARYAYNKEFFQGTSETEFSPNTAMSRAMLATVLYRRAGQPAVSFAESFSDVENGIWYTNAIMWANGDNIVKGYGNGIFAPDDFITREQIAVMLYRYAKGKAMMVEKDKITLNYSDASDISAYAVDAMTWAVAKGLIEGNTETTINPKGIATRAEVATILMRYDELL